MPFFLMVLSQAFGIARTSKNLPVIRLIDLAAVALVIVQLVTRGDPSGAAESVALGLAVFGALTMQWYIRVFSNYGRKASAAITRGQPLPELPLQQLDKTATSSAGIANLLSPT